MSNYGLPLAEPEQVGMSSERLGRIRPTFLQFVEKNYAPGFITAIARDGQLVHYETVGFMNLTTRIPMQSNTIFRLHSQTKPIVGVAVMMLFEQGNFSLNDPIANYLPEFTDMEVLQKDGSRIPANPITIKHLLTHTAGLSYYIYPDTQVGKMYIDAGLITSVSRLDGTTSEEYVKKIAALPLIAQPGTVWRYSEAMAVLGRLIEVVSGLSLGNFLHRYMFKPLGMFDTGFFVQPSSFDRFATQYFFEKSNQSLVEVPKEDLQNRLPTTANDYSRPPSFESGSSGLVGSAPDYLRFAQMLLNGGELDGVQLLSPVSVDAILTNRLGPEFGEAPLATLGSYAPSCPGIGFGFCGLVVTDIAATGWTGSSGEYSWGGGANTDFWIDRKENLIGMVMTQVTPPGAIPSRERIHQMAYQAIVKTKSSICHLSK